MTPPISQQLATMARIACELEILDDKIISAKAESITGRPSIHLLRRPYGLQADHVFEYSLSLQKHVVEMDGVEVFWFEDKTQEAA